MSSEEINAASEITPENSEELAKEEETANRAIAKQNKTNMTRLAKTESRGLENINDPDIAEETNEDIFVEGIPDQSKVKGISSRLLSPLHFTALKAKHGINSVAHRVVRKLIHIDIQQIMANSKETKVDGDVFKSMPKDWQKGDRFAQLMDQYVPLQERQCRTRYRSCSQD